MARATAWLALKVEEGDQESRSVAAAKSWKGGEETDSPLEPPSREECGSAHTLILTLCVGLLQNSRSQVCAVSSHRVCGYLIQQR